MRKSLFLTLMAGFVLLASQAQAGTLSSATWTASFQGIPFTLVIGSGSVGGTPDGALGLVAGGSAAGTGATANFTNLNVSVIPFTTSITVPPPPAALSISQILGGNQVINLNPGSLPTASGGVGAPGTVNVFLYVGFPLFFLGVPLNVGGIGSETAQGFNPLVTHVTVTASFLGWQIKPITITNLTDSGAPLSNAMFTGTNNLVNGVGTVTLVAPAVTRICAGGGTDTAGSCTGASQFSRQASATTLKLTFVPEPGVLLLLGAGLAGLVLVGRRNSN